MTKQQYYMSKSAEEETERTEVTEMEMWSFWTALEYNENETEAFLK